MGEERGEDGAEGFERERERGRQRSEGEEGSGAEAPGLEKSQVIRVLLYGEDGSVGLPNLGTQHVFILIELCFYCRSIFGLEIYHNSLGVWFTHSVTFSLSSRHQFPIES